jgi:Ca-activated chloride channel family protein
MSFLAPAALGLLALSIPLVVLYMLRSRRQVQEVPSTMLWEGEEQFVSSSLPWQRLKITGALLLQLLALAAFALLLARPFVREATLLGPHTVIVIDTSGSMATSGRFETALAEARRLAEDASEAQLVSVVEAGPTPRVLAAFSREPADVRAALDSLQVGGGIEDLAGALQLARGLATPDRPTSVLLMSDGGIEGALTEPVADARHVLYDQADANVAITAFSTGVPGEGVVRLFAEVANFSGRPGEVVLDVAVEGLATSSHAVAIEPAGRTRQIIEVDAGPGDLVTVALRDHDDANPLDDRASLVLAGARDLSVTVVGEGSPFLDALVRALPGFGPAVGAAPDLAIIDGASAAVIDRPAWVIAPETPPPGIEIVGVLENPVITFQQPSEPLLDGIDMSDVVIGSAQIVEAPGWFPIVSAGSTDLVLLGDVAGRRVVYFTFDLVESNLPVLVGFPILGSRIMSYLGGGGVTSGSTAVAGTPIPVAVPAGATATVARPDGGSDELTSGTLDYTATDLPGVYRVVVTDEEGTVLSQVRTVRQFAPGESIGSARQLSTVVSDDIDPSESSLLREWAPAILAAVLLIVLVEWWVAYGRPRPWRRTSLERVTA